MFSNTENESRSDTEKENIQNSPEGLAWGTSLVEGHKQVDRIQYIVAINIKKLKETSQVKPTKCRQKVAWMPLCTQPRSQGPLSRKYPGCGWSRAHGYNSNLHRWWIFDHG